MIQHIAKLSAFELPVKAVVGYDYIVPLYVLRLKPNISRLEYTLSQRRGQGM